MANITLAVPSKVPGGLEAAVDQHFGHCGVYTLVDVDDNTVTAVRTVENVPHTEGSCLVSVQHLADNGVTALLAGGMGRNPLMGFQQKGIEVFFAGGFPTVGMAVQAYLDKRLQAFSADQTCKGHH